MTAIRTYFPLETKIPGLLAVGLLGRSVIWMFSSEGARAHALCPHLPRAATEEKVEDVAFSFFQAELESCPKMLPHLMAQVHRELEEGFAGPSRTISVFHLDPFARLFLGLSVERLLISAYVLEKLLQ